MARQSRADLLATIERLEQVQTQMDGELVTARQLHLDAQKKAERLEGHLDDLRQEKEKQEMAAAETLQKVNRQNREVLHLLQAIVDGDLQPTDLYGLLSTLAEEHADLIVEAAKKAHMDLGPTGLEKELLVELEEGRKIHAIKLYRDSTGVGLKDAKDFVEALQAKYLG